MLVGRELYRYGYMTNEGPSSHIREAGAIPLNIAEIFMLLGIGALAWKYFLSRFFRNRKFIKRLTMSKIDRKTEEVLDKLSRGKPV